MAAENAAVTNIPWHAGIRLRFAVAETNGASDTVDSAIEYASTTNGPWTQVSAGELTAFKVAATAHYETGDPTAARLQGDGRTYTPGRCVEAPSLVVPETAISSNRYSEFEWCLRPTAKATGGSDYFFRLSGLNGYAVYPRLRMAAGSAQEPPSWGASASATGNVGRLFTHELLAAGTEPIAYGASGLPPDFSFDGTNLLSGIPQSEGVFAGLLVSASNAFGSCTQSLTLVVAPRDTTLVVSNSTTLTGDILVTSGHGIVVDADNIVIDGGGHRLVYLGDMHGIINPGYPNESGVYMPQRANVIVRNFSEIRRFVNGVYAHGGRSNRVTDCRFVQNVQTGVSGSGINVHSNLFRESLWATTISSAGYANEVTDNVMVGGLHELPTQTGVDTDAYERNRFLHQSRMRAIQFSETTRQRVVGAQIDFSLTLHALDGSAAPGMPVTLRTVPVADVAWTKAGNAVSGQFTPSRPGAWSLIAETTDAKGNESVRLMKFFVGATGQDAVTYYLNDGDTWHGQIGPGPHQDASDMRLSPPTEEGYTICGEWVQLSPDELHSAPLALIRSCV